MRPGRGEREGGRPGVGFAAGTAAAVVVSFAAVSAVAVMVAATQPVAVPSVSPVVVESAVRAPAVPAIAGATELLPAAPLVAGPPVPAPTPAALPAAAPAPAPAPAEPAREIGSWFAHGYTLELRPDGTGTFAAWANAFDGHRIHLRLIPAPGPATVADITGIDTVGGGALAPDRTPGVGGLVTIALGDAIRTAHVEWTSGPRRSAVDLCPTEGLDATAMAVLRCGA